MPGTKRHFSWCATLTYSTGLASFSAPLSLATVACLEFQCQESCELGRRCRQAQCSWRPGSVQHPQKPKGAASNHYFLLAVAEASAYVMSKTHYKLPYMSLPRKCRPAADRPGCVVHSDSGQVGTTMHLRLAQARVCQDLPQTLSRWLSCWACHGPRWW